MPSEWNYIMAAYGITWVVLIGYGIHVVRRLRAARRDNEEMRRTLEVES
ncbi:MAG TPA: hypothetical protein VJ957_10270 [Longimicrobiales bacterium]|nr:hypothetical protein [Longimicrobiales bacterium]